MNVSNNKVGPRHTLLSRLGQHDTPERKEPSVKARARSDVQISPAARKLQEYLAAPEPFDSARVNEVRQLIDQGKYETNAEVLADHLLANMFKGTGQ